MRMAKRIAPTFAILAISAIFTPHPFAHEFKDPNRHWISTNLYFLTPGINTFLVSTSEVPRTLADLLAPKWRGRIAWSNNPTAGARRACHSAGRRTEAWPR